MNIEIPRVTVNRALGKSALGTTYAATDYAGREVVVEIATELSTAEYRARFLRDAMIAERLEGEHILRVLDVGTTKEGHPFLVREPVIASIASEVHARGPLPADEAVRWTLQACEAIAEGHALGMAHGDVRSENVFLARNDRGDLVVKVRWTSAAKAEHAVQEDQQRDIAGLGEVLRAMLSGQVDLGDEDRAHTLPTPLADVIAYTLARAGGRRFANVGELANALAPFAPDSPSPRNIAFLLSRAGIPAVPPRTTTPQLFDTAPAVPPRTATPQFFDTAPRYSRPSIPTPLPPPPSRGKRVATWSLVAGLVGVVAIGSFWAWKNDQLPQWTGTADPAEFYGTTTLTSADIRKEGTSDELAADVTDEGIVQRAAPIEASLQKVHAPKEKAAFVWTSPEAREDATPFEPTTTRGTHETPATRTREIPTTDESEPAMPAPPSTRETPEREP